jgi:hypothetical protein
MTKAYDLALWLLPRVTGLFLRGTKIINMDMCATIMRMCRQSQIHGQSPTPIA